jgi:hypothetical protein
MKGAFSLLALKFLARVVLCSGIFFLGLPFLTSLFLGLHNVVIGGSTPGSNIFIKEAKARVVRPAPVRRAPGLERRAPVRREARVNHHHTPRSHINTYVYTDTESGTAMTSLPDDCEKVSGEDATFYCEGMYFRAKFQGNEVVYVPESSME